MREKVKKELVNMDGRKQFSKLSKLSKEYVLSESKRIGRKRAEIIYMIINNMKSPGVCKNCGVEVSMVRGPLRYREYCSGFCKNKWIYENTDIKNRISKSVKKYAKEIRENGKKFKQTNKRLNTMIEKGKILPVESWTDYKKYYRTVWRLTSRIKNRIKELPNSEKRGRYSKTKNNYSLDHKYSIFQGFKDNILPIIIADISNLEFMPSLENSKKSKKCSVTKDELFKGFYDK